MKFDKIQKSIEIVFLGIMLFGLASVLFAYNQDAETTRYGFSVAAIILSATYLVLAKAFDLSETL